MIHFIRHSVGYARSYFDERGVRRQEDDYRVKITCECGHILDAPIFPNDEITEKWLKHKEEARNADVN